jgi:hypothetical protein
MDKNVVVYFVQKNLIGSIMTAGCMLLFGCHDDFDDLPSEFDTIGEIIGFTVADTVRSATDVRVQISFPRLCGGEFAGIQRFDDNTTIKLTPAIHVVAQWQCPDEVTFLTVATTIRFSSAGNYTVIGHGRFLDIPKKVVVVSSYTPPQVYRLRYTFISVTTGLPSKNQVSEFILTDNFPPTFYQIQADSNGVWQTTLPDTVPQLNYRLAGLDFRAVRGVKEDGIILVK